MKHNIFIYTFFSFICIICSYSANAVNTESTKHLLDSKSLTIEQFIALDITKLQSNTLTHISWLQKIALKNAQKRLKKMVAKGKVDASKNLFQNEESFGNNGLGIGSCILGIGTLLLILFPSSISILAIPLSLVGLILGIKGIKKDKKIWLAVSGTILNSIFFILFLIAFFVFISGGFSYKIGFHF